MENYRHCETSKHLIPNPVGLVLIYHVKVIVPFRDGWFTLNIPNGNGNLDMAFLFVFATKMYISGHIDYRIDSKKKSTWETLGIGLFRILSWLGYWANVHSFNYYMTIQMVAGSLFQPTRCPLVVAMLGNWVCNKEVTYNGYLACSHIYWKPYGVHIRINIIWTTDGVGQWLLLISLLILVTW